MVSIGRFYLTISKPGAGASSPCPLPCRAAPTPELFRPANACCAVWVLCSRRPRAPLQPEPPLAAGGLDLLAGGLDEAGLPLGDDDVAEQLPLLLFAGYETTASSLSCLLLSLLQNPSELVWLQQELDGLAWPPAQGEELGAYDASRAPRLDVVLKEVMRLAPPVGGFFVAPGSRLCWRMCRFRPIWWCR